MQISCVLSLPKALAALAFGAVLTISAAPAWSEEELVLAFIPQENPEKLIGDIDVISTWLAGQIGVPVRGFRHQ